MDIPAIITALDMETRMAIRNAVYALYRHGVFDEIMEQLTKEVMDSAAVLANSPRDEFNIQRAAIRYEAIRGLITELQEATKEN